MTSQVPPQPGWPPPSYGQYLSGTAAPPPGPSGRPYCPRLGIVTLVITLLAIVLTVIAFFLPYIDMRQEQDGELGVHMAYTPWQMVLEYPDVNMDELGVLGSQHAARYDIPLSCILLVLTMSVVLRAISAVRGRSALPELARITAVLGGAPLAAAVWTVAINASAMLSINSRPGSTSGSFESMYSINIGLWVLLAAGVACVASCVLAAFDRHSTGQFTQHAGGCANLHMRQTVG